MRTKGVTDREKITTMARLLGTLHKELKRSAYIASRRFVFDDDGTVSAIYEQDKHGEYKLVAGVKQ